MKTHSAVSMRRDSLVTLIPAMVLAAMLSGSVCKASGDAEPAVASRLQNDEPRHCRCLWTVDPTTAATISWSTLTDAGPHLVRFRLAGTGPWHDLPAHRNGRFTGDEMELHYHHARLRDLTPGSDYQVVCVSAARESRIYTFRTAPIDDVPVSLLFGADSRSDREARRKMNAMLANMVAESYSAKRAPILALAHGGDYVVDGNRIDLWNGWLSDYEATTSQDRLLPLIPARGNHDVGKIFNELFDFDPQFRDYYAIDLGSQIRFVTLNTETSVAGDQTKWLDQELRTSRPEYRWLVAQYHRPAIAAVKLPFRALTYWVPLFEKYNLDLACEGDGHCIKRTAPIRRNQVDSTGVVYIGEGGLGVEQRAPKVDRWFLREPHGKAGEGHHVQLLTFGPEAIQYRAVLMGGEIFDDHRIPVRGAAK
ncbi:MAG: metallophosphoesterase family protein [Planctomycetales bacterium]|nr:metallophosphoesterase family protein [Planctomycetales bacterium]